MQRERKPEGFTLPPFQRAVGISPTVYFAKCSDKIRKEQPIAYFLSILVNLDSRSQF
jgi:hypothetical protein